MIDSFEEVKRQVAEVTSKRDKAAGAYEQTLKRIKEKFGCKTHEEAEALLLRLEKKERTTAADYTKEFEAFKKAWNEKLEELEDDT